MTAHPLAVGAAATAAGIAAALIARSRSRSVGQSSDTFEQVRRVLSFSVSRGAKSRPAMLFDPIPVEDEETHGIDRYYREA